MGGESDPESGVTAPGPAPRFERVGLLAALPQELGDFAEDEGRHRHASGLFPGGLRSYRPDGFDGHVVAGICGIGKVAAAAAASALIAEGVDLVLVVGTCGGLHSGERVGDFVHARDTMQWDLAVRAGRLSQADPRVLDAWQAVAPGAVGTILTADRPAIRWIERARRARALRRHPTRPVVADMETAAIAAVAGWAQVPWAALRVVSDRRVAPWEALFRRHEGSFVHHFDTQAPRPAATVRDLLAELVRRRADL